jgi:hypothetical protein
MLQQENKNWKMFFFSKSVDEFKNSQIVKNLQALNRDARFVFIDERFRNDIGRGAQLDAKFSTVLAREPTCVWLSYVTRPSTMFGSEVVHSVLSFSARASKASAVTSTIAPSFSFLSALNSASTRIRSRVLKILSTLSSATSPIHPTTDSSLHGPEETDNQSDVDLLIAPLDADFNIKGTNGIHYSSPFKCTEFHINLFLCSYKMHLLRVILAANWRRI